MLEQPASLPYVDAPVIAGLEDVDHWDEAAARRRLDWLRPELPFEVPDDARFTGGNSNDMWEIADGFLKVCWRADRSRIHREAAVLTALPPEVPHPDLLGAGTAAGLSWSLTGRLPGTTLFEVESGVTPEELRALYRQAFGILRSLHEWEPPAPLRTTLQERASIDEGSALSAWGADYIPLPLSRALSLADLVKIQPGVDDRLIDEVVERLIALADADPFLGSGEDFVVVHGDPAAGNWLASNGRVTGLIDWEHVRMGPPDLELVTPIHLFNAGQGASGWTEAPYLEWLEEDYPEIFAAPDLDRRLWLYELCWWFRLLIWWPPVDAERADAVAASVRTLLDGPAPRRR